MDLDGFINGIDSTYTPGKSPAASMQAKLKLINLAKAIMAMQPYRGVEKWYVPESPYDIRNLPKHKAFFEAGASFRERLLCLSNRSGKTISGAYELALHLTGRYPYWWTGDRKSVV